MNRLRFSALLVLFTAHAAAAAVRLAVFSRRQGEKTLRPPGYRSRIVGLSFLSAMLLAGCIVIPYPTSKEPLPFDDEALARITPGATSRDEIIAQFGEPFAERSGRAVALYGLSRKVGGMFVLSRSNPDIFDTIESEHLLLVRYDENEKVQALDTFRFGSLRLSPEGCAEDGLCVRPRFVRRNDAYLAGAYFYDTPENDAAARTFEIPPDRCGVFVYYDANMRDDDMRVFDSADADRAMQIDKSGYLFRLHDPGTVGVGAAFRVNSFDFWTVSVPSGTRIASDLEFHCVAGQAQFVEVRLTMGWTQPEIVISLEAPGEGTAALERRRLMLDF